MAKGAALYAAIVSPNLRVRDFEIVDKTPYGIGLHWTEVDKTTLVEKASNAEIFKANGALKSTKIISFNRDADFEFTAKYMSPADVIGGISIIGLYKVNLLLVGGCW